MLAARKSLGGLARAAEARKTPNNLGRSDYNIRQELRATYEGIPQHPLSQVDGQKKVARSVGTCPLTTPIIN